MERICVFCGSSAGTQEAYGLAARDLGRALVAHKLDLVYGGGRVGLMGILADSVLAAGGRAFGVIPEALADKEVAHAGLTELTLVPSMHERKAAMVEMADAFIALPGGFGTYDELCEILTWAQLGFHRKPIALLNVAGFYDGLLTFFDQATREGFVRRQHRDMILVEQEPTLLLRSLMHYVPDVTPKWITRDEL
ncbi:MAG: TIGR00730 family Rossman fold protein [Anaerolineae bacterium]|nr:TIGR00730 family Rossman fold protein [Anaerolineae bacterium]